MISMNEEQFELDNTPDAENLWKAIGGSFSNISQAINEFVDDSISNFRRNCGNAAMIRTVRLTLNACGEMVNITVEDGGTGIRNLSNATADEHGTSSACADRHTARTFDVVASDESIGISDFNRNGEFRIVHINL